MKKFISIIVGIIAGIITFYFLVTAFADEPKIEKSNLNLRYDEIKTEIQKEEFEIIYVEPETEEIEKINDIEERIIKSIEETETKIENTYKIKSGDNFWNICEKIYGDGNYYCFALAEYNDLNIDSIIISGHKLIIPNIEDEEFAELVNKYKIEAVENDLYTLNERAEPAVEITIPTGDDMRNYTEEVDTSNYQYIGDWNITGYDPNCSHCCGGNTHGIGAAGVEVIPGYSVATKDLPLNITLYIEGYGFYVNEDRGCGDGTIDIVCPSHEACYLITNMDGVAVYIVE